MNVDPSLALHTMQARGFWSWLGEYVDQLGTPDRQKREEFARDLEIVVRNILTEDAA